MRKMAYLLVLMLLGWVSKQQEGSINYKGNFDSMNPNPSEQVQQAQEEQEDSIYQQQEQDMLQFSEHMADFFPDETFTFKLQPKQQQQFMLWPGVEVETIRGMFHSELTDNEDSDSYVSLTIYNNSVSLRSYNDQRLGIFNVAHSQKDNRYTFKFQNGQSSSEVYFSYEFLTKQKREGRGEQKNETQIQTVTKKFQKVNRLIVQQQSQMKRLMGISERHQQKVERYLSSLLWTLVFETFLISAGNCASLWLLKKQLYAGYQLLV